jgi:hypothetical protein
VPVSPIGGQERAQIQLVEHIEHESGQMVARQPVAQIGWKQERLVTVAGKEVVGHGRSYATRQPAYGSDRPTRPAATSRPSTPGAVLDPTYLRPRTNSASIGKASPAAPCHGSSAAWTSATNPARAAGPAAPTGPASGEPAP